MPSFVDIVNDVCDRTGQSQTTDTPAAPAAVTRRLKRYINTWNRRVLSAQGMSPLRRVIVTQASVADQPTYGVALQSIQYITETTTQRKLDQATLGWYRARYPDPSVISGTPDWYVPLGLARIENRPSAPCQLFVVSTAAGDGAGTTAKVEAIRTGGSRVSLSVAMNGLTPVSLGAAYTDVIDVNDFYLSGASVGTVTLTQGSGGAELSRIPIGATVGRFLRYALAPTPSAVITYQIDGIADVADLVNDTDEPFPNPDFHDILVLGAVHEEWLFRGKAAEARMILHGGNPTTPTPESVEGRIRRLRCSILEWGYSDPRHDIRTFDETIHLPVV